MKSLALTLAATLFLFGLFVGGKQKHKAKPKPKHKVAAATVIPADKSACSFSLQFPGDKSWRSYVTADVHPKFGINGYFSMIANFKSGEKFEISYIASDKAPTPRYQLKRTPETVTKYYIRFIQRDHSELYFSGYDLNFINTKDGITSDIKLLTAGHNTMQSLRIRLLKIK